MQNTDNLRTLTGRKCKSAPKPIPSPIVQDNASVPNHMNVLPEKKNMKGKKFAYIPPNQRPKKARSRPTFIQNDPSVAQNVAAPTNLITIRPPGPNNTLNQSSRGPITPTGPINTKGQTGGIQPNEPTWSVNTVVQSSGSGTSEPTWLINPLGQISGSGSINIPKPVNTVGQTSASGTNNPPGPVNAPDQTTGSGSNMPKWSVNPIKQTSGSEKNSRLAKPLGQTGKTESNNPPGPTKPGPMFQPPQQEPTFILAKNTTPKIPVIGEQAKGNSKRTNEIASWMKFVRGVEEMAEQTEQNTKIQQDLFNQHVTSAQILPQMSAQILPQISDQILPQMPDTQAAATSPFNNIKINLNRAAFEQQQKLQKSKRQPRVHDPSMLTLSRYAYPKGIPRSFYTQTMKDNLNAAQSNITTSYETATWIPPNQGIIAPNTPTFAPQPQGVEPQAMVTNNPIFVETDPQIEVHQPYSPSDAYAESSFGGNNSREEHDGSESSEVGLSAQKRLSAFQRLGPLSQPKKPKLTINLMFNKEQAVREVVDVTVEDTDKYTPVHLRQDIIASTDETIVKFLPSWPWQRRVPLRRSVTYRHSKSVMILEQEQMEEIYNKDNVFMQVTVKGYPKDWKKEHVLDALLEVVKGNSFIPCFTEITDEECKFLVLRNRLALVTFHKCGFVVRKDGVELTIVISQTDVSLNQIDYIPRLVLRKRLMNRYDGERKLDLKEFTLRDDISHFIYYPLNRITNQKELIQLQSTVAWDYLTDLDLSHNRLTSISGLDLPSTTPRLKHLNLSHNYIEKVTHLLICRNLTIHSIWLEGNPLCLDYIDSQHYIKVVKMMFSSIKEIDGVPITLRGDLPPINRNYCSEGAVEFVEKFLEVYFPLLDSTTDDRAYIQNLYTDDAIMTITYRSTLRHGPVYRCFRNLFLRSRALDEGDEDSVETASSIVKLINRWPEFEHDPLTFTVDVLHYDDFSAILRVGGIVKLKAESLAEEEHMLAFTRTFVLRSKDGSEYKIQNEMLYWDHPTEEYVATAFKVTTVKTKQLSLKLDSTPGEDLKDKLIDLFMKMTTLNRKASERCLEMKSWNFKDALEHFTKLLKLDSLESLTKDEV